MSHSANPPLGTIVNGLQYGFMPLNSLQAQQQQSQQQSQQAAALAQQYNKTYKQHQYMIDGRFMDIREFVDEIWPEDCPEKTWFVLKYSKGDSNDN
jgi:predicted exporter